MGVIRWVLVVALSLATSANAGLIYTAIADPNLAPDANSNFSGNVNLYNVTTSSPGNASVNGSFFNAGSWGLYANSGNQAIANSLAFASLTDVGKALNKSGEFVQFTLDHGSIQAGGSIGVFFRDTSSNVVSTVFFNGGDTVYRVTDGTGANSSTGVGFNPNAFTFGVTINNTSGSYTVNLNGTNITRTLAGGSNNINSFSVFNNNAGGGSGADVLFSMVMFNAVPEPTTLALLATAGSAGVLAVLRRRRLNATALECLTA